MTGDKLFSYGTLQDIQVQHALLGKHLEGVNAWISDWGLYMGSDGYLFIKPLVGARVAGQIFCIDTADLAVTDLWEDCDVYLREQCRAFLDDGSRIEAWVYTRRNHEGRRFAGPTLHGRALSDLQMDIRQCLKTKNQT